MRRPAHQDPLPGRLSGDPRGDPEGHVRIGLRRGEPRSVILKVASSAVPTCSLSAPQGRSGLAKMFLDSIAEGVIRAATCDVLVA
ncbi:MAG: universal stress protein [Hyphomicrobium sp.]